MSIDELRFGADGLLPVIVQDARTGAVLTLAYANREALERTIAERSTYLYSRSRGELWHKGATSGNVQRVVGIDYDCDADALLYRVEPQGPACHTGAASCFDAGLLAGEPRANAGDGELGVALRDLQATIAQRHDAPPETSYTARLRARGVDTIGKKIGEEATEVVIAAKNHAAANDESREKAHGELVWEVADLLYHTMVLLDERGIAPGDVGAELARRRK